MENFTLEFSSPYYEEGKWDQFTEGYHNRLSAQAQADRLKDEWSDGSKFRIRDNRTGVVTSA